MKKKLFIGIVTIILMAMAFNFNISQSSHKGVIPLLSIKIMASAAGENYCTQNLTGYFCYEFLGNKNTRKKFRM